MRHLGILLLAACPAAIFAQTPEADHRVLQTLLSEVQQLRMAIERQTLLGTRTQIAISQLQLQEGRVAAATKELASTHDQAMQMKLDKAKGTGAVKDLESQLSRPEFSSAEKHAALEAEIKGFKMHLEMISANEQQLFMREGELTAQFQAAQRDVQDSRSRIAEMEKALDAAIQQMLKGQR